MNEEDEAFNEIERRSKVKQELVRQSGWRKQQIAKEAQLTAEVAVLTEMVRVLSDKVAEMEQGWSGLTNDKLNEILVNAAHIEAKLKEKNT